MREEKPSLDTLMHIGVKRRSGRYPWGSGEEPHQHSRTFLSEVDSLRKQGVGDTEISRRLELTTTQLRNKITWANAEINAHNVPQAKKLFEAGLSKVAIGKKLGVSEATVRNYLSDKTPAEKAKKVQLDNIHKAIESGVANTGYLDVGVGVERQLGVSRNKFNTVVNKLAEDGEYHIHSVQVKRLSDPTGSKWTTVKVLTKDPDPLSATKNSDKIRPLDTWSEDGGQSIAKLTPPHMVSLDRIKIRYAEEGGKDKDGTIELRPGTKDLDMGNSKYAQVRIAAGENLYLKGMAIYGEPKDFPKGVDIIYNRPESNVIPKEQVLKKMKMTPDQTDDPSFMFGSSVRRQKGALNIVYEEGEWDKWSGTMSSQFLSKQSTSLIKDRLDDTYAGLKHEFDEINSMTNPVVKKYLMDKYTEGLDSKAKHLKAKGLSGTKSHVLLPFPDMKPNEVYAPNFNNGDRVVLVRHPHGGVFEIPDLVVNNKHEGAKKVLGTDTPDAIGIHPSVAEKLSGADFDGDTALVIPNKNGEIKTSRSLKELKNFEPKDIYKVDHETMNKKTMEMQMGMASNLIADMTIKDASHSELARAVRHSMVVIDAHKHKLDYKQSERDHQIAALRKKYQTHINPETGKISRGASTLISRSKQKIDISQHETAKQLYKDKVDKNGNILKKGLTPEEIAKKLKVSKETIDGYLFEGKVFNPDKYSSGLAQEQLYLGYIKGVIGIKNEAIKTSQSIVPPDYSREAAKMYPAELRSLNDKLNIALLNAPKARQVQILTNKLYYSNLIHDMDNDQKKKLRSRALAKATVTVGAKATKIEISQKEWEAIQAGAISKTKLIQILDHANIDTVRKHAAPRELKLNSAKLTRARTYLDKGYTYAEISNILGVSPTTLREELK
jgi:DNA-binding CsgD family transcriptional regulator